MDRGRVAVFVGYEENTVRQFRIYAPDLGYVTKATVVVFDEFQKGGPVDLRIRTTPNTLSDRQPRGRLRKNPAADAPMPNRSETDIEGQTTDDANRKPGLRLTSPNKASAEPEIFLYVEIPRRQSTPEPESPNDSAPQVDPAPQVERSPHVEIPRQNASTDQPETPSQPHPDGLQQPDRSIDRPDNSIVTPTNRFVSEVPLVTGKRDREDDEDEYDLRSRKVHRAFPVQYRIPIPKTYKEAVEDPIFGAEWLDAINREKGALQVNRTWEEILPPPGANVISSR